MIDPFRVVCDPKMPFLAKALNPVEVQAQFQRRLTRLAGENARINLCLIRVTRYKRGRRCLIEYDVEVQRDDAPPEKVTLVGKTRARGLDGSGDRLLELLWSSGFHANCQDGISVPQPLGAIPEFQMWLQRKVPGTAATRLLIGSDGVSLARRIADAAHKLHGAGILPDRQHTMADELRILRNLLAIVARMTPRWTERLQRLVKACDRLGAATQEPDAHGIHRDFYPDHVIVDGPRLYLLDFDLYCLGDPALDIGNFLGHLTEYSLRTLGDPDGLSDVKQALEEAFVALAGEATRATVRAYETLTLARHIFLTTQFPERRSSTEQVFEVCEQRLGIGAP